MKLSALALRNIGTFRGEHRLDLDALGAARLIAVHGPNGAGKSSLLELLPGALDRRCPTRGRLLDLATSRDSYVEARVHYGQALTIRHTLDPVAGKGESWVGNGDGSPLLDDAKVTTFDAWRALHLPSPAVVFASTFAAQAAGGFLDMSPGDRKAVLLRTLGIEHLELLAEAARRHLAETRDLVRQLESSRAEVLRQAGDPDAADDAVAAAEYEEIAAADSLERARVALQTQRERHADLVRAHEDRDRALAERREARDRVAAARGREESLVWRLANNAKRIGAQEDLLAGAEAIRAAAARLAEIDRDLPEARAAAGAAENEALAKGRQLEQAQARHRDIGRRRQAADRRRAGLQETLSRADAARKAKAAVPAVSAAWQAAKAAVEGAERLLEAERGRQVSGLGDRVDALRGGLLVIQAREDWDGSHARGYAGEVLDADDGAVRTAHELPGRLAAAELAVRKARGEELRARDDLEALRRQVDELPRIEQAERELVDVKAEVEQLHVDDIGVCAEIRGAEDRLPSLRESATRARARAGDLAMERLDVEKAAKRADELAAAERILAELRAQDAATEEDLARAREDLAAATAEMERHPEPPNVAPVPDLAEQEARARAAEQALQVARDVTSRRRAALEAVERAIARAEEIAAEAAAATVDADEWRLLAEALGRQGIQALEVDAAGPELTAQANDLIHAAYGSRFTVSIETTRLSADGARELESCEVRVLDTERGTDGPADRLSGGERVLVGEAVRLALTAVACRIAGVLSPTLIRDESGAALDTQAGPAWLAMLRRAADLIGADRVLFVSHDSALWALADARIEVRDGQIHTHQ